MPAVFTVTNTLDNVSPGSLHWAITQANKDTASPSIINFAIPVSGIHTIQVRGSGLPTITHPVIIDGESEAFPLGPSHIGRVAFGFHAELWAQSDFSCTLSDGVRP
jgi:hypothetical protein